MPTSAGQPISPQAEQVARELMRELRELPSQIRMALSRSHCTPDAVAHLAQAMEHTLDEIQGHTSARHLRAQATSLRAQIARAVQMLLDLQSFAGQLDGLAWAIEARDSAEETARRPG